MKQTSLEQALLEQMLCSRVSHLTPQPSLDGLNLDTTTVSETEASPAMFLCLK